MATDSNGDVLQFLDTLISTVDGMVSRMQSDVYIALYNVWASADGAPRFWDISGTVSRAIADAWAYTERQITAIFGRISGYIAALLRNIEDSAQAVVDSIMGAISSFIASVESTWNRIIATINSVIDQALNYIANIVDSIIGTVMAIIDNALSDIWVAFNTIVDRIDQFITGIYDVIEQFYYDTIDFITETIDGIVDSTEILITGMQELITETIDKAWEQTLEIIEPITEFLMSLPGMFLNIIEDLKIFIADNIGTPLANLPINLAESFGKSLLEGLESSLPEGDDLIKGLLAAIGLTPEIMDKARVGPTLDLLQKTPLFVIALVIAVPLMLFGVVQTAATPAQTKLLQRLGRDVPYQVLSPPDAAASQRRGFTSIDTSIEDIRSAGYTEEQADILINLDKLEITENQAVRLWLRGLTTEGELNNQLRVLGYQIKDLPSVRELAHVLPPVQDLILMAVREVFTPEIAQRFGQFQDFPEAFVVEAAKVGLTRKIALNYWAAHWALPSLTMGFEMLHRRVITDDDIDLLMRAHDVMPFWRDKVKAISYRPFTRVDVRRMHKIGVLDDDQVLSAYLDLGYNQEKAKSYVEFTKLYNEFGLDLEADDTASLTRSQVEKYYAMGMLNGSEAFELLQTMGYGDDSANLILDAIDLKADLSLREEQKDVIIDKAISRIISFEQAQDELGALGLPSREIELASLEIEKGYGTKTKMPSKTDLDGFWNAGLITELEYRDAMDGLGYPKKWIDLYVLMPQKG